MIYDQKTLAEIVQQNRNAGKKTIFTNGCFDIMHPGHVRYLEQSKKLGDLLIVGLNSDASVKRLKGESRPINQLEDRAVVMAALKAVDYVTWFEEDTPANLINTIKPDIITKGGDYEKEKVVGYDIVREYGGDVVILDFVAGKSTTNIINKSKN